MSEFDYLLSEPITWFDTGDARLMYRARHGSHRLEIRINDWPDRSTYTLFVDGAAVFDIEGWPAAWTQLRKKRHFR